LSKHNYNLLTLNPPEGFRWMKKGDIYEKTDCWHSYVKHITPILPSQVGKISDYNEPELVKTSSIERYIGYIRKI
jgi:hypothetical protein